MSHQIKIDADINLSKLRKSLGEITQLLGSISNKHAIELFDKDSIDFLKGQARESLVFLKREYELLTNQAGKYREELKKMATLTDDRRQKERQLLDVEKKRLDIATDMSKLREKMDGSKQPGFLDGFGSQMRNLPGGGILSRIMGGSSIGMMAGIAGGALVAGGAWHAYSKAREGNAQYNDGLRSRVALMGRGVGDYRGLNAGMSGMGYSPEEVRQAQLQSTDIFGREGSSSGAVFGRARFARANGVDLGSLQGMGGGLRASLGVSQGNKAFAELEASLISNKIKDAIGPYLETAASMLTELNENGMSFDPTGLAALGSLINLRGMSPEAASKMITGVDARIKGSTGGLNAFFQAAFAGGGLGGGTLGGSQEAVNLGLFGLDSGKASKYLKPNELGAYQRMGLTGGGGMQKRFGGIRSMVEGMGFGDGDEGVVQKGLMLQRIFGTKSGAEGLKYYNAMSDASNARPEDREKMLSSIQSEFGSNEERALKLQGDQKALLEQIGETVSPAFQAANRALMSIDATLLQIAAKGFGIQIPEGGDFRRSAMLGKEGMTLSSVESMSPEQTMSEMTRIRANIKRSQARTKSEMRSLTPDVGESMLAQSVNAEGDMAEVLGILRRHLDVAQQQLREIKKPAVTGVQGRQSTLRKK